MHVQVPRENPSTYSYFGTLKYHPKSLKCWSCKISTGVDTGMNQALNPTPKLGWEASQLLDFLVYLTGQRDWKKKGSNWRWVQERQAHIKKNLDLQSLYGVPPYWQAFPGQARGPALWAFSTFGLSLNYFPAEFIYHSLALMWWYILTLKTWTMVVMFKVLCKYFSAFP